MKKTMILIVATVVGGLSLALAGSSTPALQVEDSGSQALMFTSDDGHATVTLTCDTLLTGSQEGAPHRIYKLFGAYVDEQLGLIGSALASYGTLANLSSAPEPPASFKMELGNRWAVLSPTAGDWANVKSEGDVTVVFGPLEKK